MEVWSLGNVWLGARVLTGQVNPECIAHHTIGSSVTRSAAFVNFNRKLGTIITIDEGESFLGGFNIHLSLFSNRPNTQLLIASIFTVQRLHQLSQQREGWTSSVVAFETKHNFLPNLCLDTTFIRCRLVEQTIRQKSDNFDFHLIILEENVLFGDLGNNIAKFNGQ